MAVSPNGQLLSLFCKDGKLKVLSIDFQTKLAEIATTMTLPPLQMEWCGNDSVVLHWEDTVWVVGPAGDWIKYSYDGTVYLISEPDGLRIISSGGCDFLQRVPLSVEAVFRIGSTAPAAILFDAKDLYDKKNPKADECIRSIMPELHSAVDSCIDAAGHELDPEIQKQLLRAASFGKCFLDTYPAEKFVDMCKTLRVLNAIREPPTGIFLTYGQLQTSSHDAVVQRMLKRNLHLLAFKVASYLDLDYHGVLIHWACYKVGHFYSKYLICLTSRS
jgi:hypothetical protein